MLALGQTIGRIETRRGVCVSSSMLALGQTIGRIETRRGVCVSSSMLALRQTIGRIETQRGVCVSSSMLALGQTIGRIETRRGVCGSSSSSKQIRPLGKPVEGGAKTRLDSMHGAKSSAFCGLQDTCIKIATCRRQNHTALGLKSQCKTLQAARVGS